MRKCKERTNRHKEERKDGLDRQGQHDEESTQHIVHRPCEYNQSNVKHNMNDGKHSRGDEEALGPFNSLLGICAAVAMLNRRFQVLIVDSLVLVTKSDIVRGKGIVFHGASGDTTP